MSAEPCSHPAQHSRAAPAALYEATVRHVRRQTIERAFTHRVYYWLVDLDPPAPTITVFGLGAPGDGYLESQTASGELVVRQPFALRVDIEALVQN